jgi:hypothetical protein
MKVFEDIMIQSKKLAEEQRRSGISRNPRDPVTSSSGNIYDAASGSSGNGSRLDEDLQGVSMTGYDQQRNGAWDPEVNEQRQELEREKEYSQTGSEHHDVVEDRRWIYVLINFSTLRYRQSYELDMGPHSGWRVPSGWHSRPSLGCRSTTIQ